MEIGVPPSLRLPHYMGQLFTTPTILIQIIWKGKEKWILIANYKHFILYFFEEIIYQDEKNLNKSKFRPL